MADVPFPTQAGQRTVVNQRGTSMDLDPSLPPPWWTEHDYDLGDIVAVGHRVYRARRANSAVKNSLITDDANRDNWVDITGIGLDIRDLPDVVGGNKDKDTATIKPNHRIYADTRLGPVTINLPPQPDWANGDIIEIVDDYRCFNKTNPCKIVANGIRINAADPYPNGEPGDLTLDIVGLQDYWRFTYFIDKENPTSQWLYVLSAPTAGSGSAQPAERKPPILVAGPADYTVTPNSVIIAKSTDGPIKITPDDTFKDGDTLIIFDSDWQFAKNPLTLLKTDTVVYDPQDVDDSGNFPLDLIGPASGWSFLFFGGRLMCVSAPINQEWIQEVADYMNGDQPSDAPPEKPSKIHPVSDDLGDDPIPEPPAPVVASLPGYPIFERVATDADVELAEAWKQYDCNLGRKKSLTVNLPPACSLPDRSRIRIRMMSGGSGVVNVLPSDTDQILGLFGTVSATGKGKARTVHGQYNMIELESDTADEWMVV